MLIATIASRIQVVILFPFAFYFSMIRDLRHWSLQFYVLMGANILIAYSLIKFVHPLGGILTIWLFPLILFASVRLKTKGIKDNA